MNSRIKTEFISKVFRARLSRFEANLKKKKTKLKMTSQVPIRSLRTSLMKLLFFAKGFKRIWKNLSKP